ncbi:cytosolic purine 5'-nucleotidase-like [Camellia sinensis]|uniref:cytosolic purine 5'-nucleotidase-like n=1 Tax=Camellia sinensis TaxID=4442 RepID=UPI00103649C4|nr:cytosolic purine 5'-nucleotidase-like [Camellia sinensis]
MDYTLMHYNVMAWEGRAYDYCMDNLKNVGFPVAGLAFDPDLVIRGLVIDKEKGNLVKADRFGYVKRAMHGTTMLSTRAVRYVLNLFIVLICGLRKSEITIAALTEHCQMVDIQRACSIKQAY